MSIYDVLRVLVDRTSLWKSEEEYRRYRSAIDKAEQNRLFKQEGDFQL